MRNTTALRIRVLARRKCKPLDVVAVALEMAMTVSMVTLLTIMMLVGGVTPYHSTMPADMATARHVVPMPNAKREDAIRIVVMRDGAIYFGHIETRATDLPNQIRQKVREGSERRAYVMVDRRAKNFDVENVVDAIRASGIWNVGLLVEQDRSVAALR